MGRLVWIAIGIALLSIGVTLGWNFFRSRPAPAAHSPTLIATTEYRCSGGKSITASEGTETVTIALSDGRKLTLPRIPTANGSRFASETGSLVPHPQMNPNTLL